MNTTAVVGIAACFANEWQLAGGWRLVGASDDGGVEGGGVRNTPHLCARTGPAAWGVAIGNVEGRQWRRNGWLMVAECCICCCSVTESVESKIFSAIISFF